MVGIKISVILSGSGEFVDPKTYPTLSKLTDASKDAYHLTSHFITPNKYYTLIDSGVDPKIITAFMTNEDANNLPKTLPPRRPKGPLTSQMTIASLVRAKVPTSEIPKFEADARSLLQERLNKAANTVAVHTPVKETVAVDTPVKEPPAKKAKNQ